MLQRYYAGAQCFCVVVKKKPDRTKKYGLAAKTYVLGYSHSIVEGGFDEMS